MFVSPLGALVGFAPLPSLFFGVLAVMVVTYLAVVQVLQRSAPKASSYVDGGARTGERRPPG